MTPRQIVEFVSQKSGVPIHEIYGRTRTKKVFETRLWVYQLLRDMGYSFPEIGDVMGKDHTTILKTLRSAKQKGIQFPELPKGEESGLGGDAPPVSPR